MNKVLLVVVAIGFACSTSSCSLWRRVTNKKKTEVAKDTAVVVVSDSTIIAATDTLVVTEPTAVDPASIALLNALRPLYYTSTSFKTFNGKAKVNYESKGEKKDFTANIRIQKDKKIWISIIGLGIFEAFRIQITPDTIIVLNRVDRQAQILPFSDIGKVLPMNVSFQTLQSLLIGDVLNSGFAPTSAHDTLNEYRLGVDNNEFTQVVTFTKADSVLRSQLLTTTNSTMIALYSDFQISSGRRFANIRVMDISNHGEAHHIDLEFNKVTFDEEVNMDFSIPSKYSRK